MSTVTRRIAVVLFLSLVSIATASAQWTIACPPNTQTAYLLLDGDVEGTLGCKLVEDERLRRLIGQLAPGTVFAWPLIGGTCFSGQLEAQLTTGQTTRRFIATAHSAQRFLPVPEAQGGMNAIAISKDLLGPDGSPDPDNGLPSLQAGAAMTFLHMRIGRKTVGLLLDDHFLSTEIADDTEDFLIVGSTGDFRVTGRLVGRGRLAPSDDSLRIEFEEISGEVCVGNR